jgi:ubiquitin-conjugating enzyme E2 H
MSNSKKRIMNDLKMLRKNNIEFEAIDTHTITCIIKGPKDTPYEKGSWKISINFPNNYPFSSPSIGFVDKIYHPNVDFNSGSICFNVLNEEWKPIYTANHIIETFIPQLLTYPNPDDPLNIEAGKLFRKNNKQFITQVKAYIFQNGLNKCV